jgi:hypothetical protein
MTERDSTGLIIVSIVAVVAITGIVLMVLNSAKVPTATVVPLQSTDLAASDANVAGQVGKAFTDISIPPGMKDRLLKDRTFTKKDASKKVRAMLSMENGVLKATRIETDSSNKELASTSITLTAYTDPNVIDLSYNSITDTIGVVDSAQKKEVARLKDSQNNILTAKESTFAKKDSPTNVEAILYIENGELKAGRRDVDASYKELSTKTATLVGYKDASAIEMTYDSLKDRVIVKDSTANKEIVVLM